MNYIRYWRKREGLNQAELALRAGVHTNSIIRWEKDRRTPSRADIEKLCAALNVSEGQLMDGPANMEVCMNVGGGQVEGAFFVGYRGDGALVINGSLPVGMDVDEMTARIRVELLAAQEGQKARDACLRKELRKEGEHDNRAGLDNGSDSELTEGD